MPPQKLRNEKTGEIFDCETAEELYVRIQWVEGALSGGTQQPDTSVRDRLRHHRALLKLSVLQWAAVAFAVGLVFSGEIFNSAIEDLSDVVCPERDDRIKKVKDLAAAAVLVNAIAAAVIGLLVFVPKIIQLF